jgi:hypothetical protein
MPCARCNPQGFYTGEYEVDQYGMYGPTPSRLWGTGAEHDGYAVPHEGLPGQPGADLSGAVPYVLLLGVLAATVWWSRKALK